MRRIFIIVRYESDGYVLRVLNGGREVPGLYGVAIGPDDQATLAAAVRDLRSQVWLRGGL